MREEKKLDDIRRGALERVEQSERHYKYAFSAVALLEAVFLLLMIWVMNFDDRLHVIIFISSLAIYTIIGAGLVVLGTYINRSTQILLKAIEQLDEKD